MRSFPPLTAGPGLLGLGVLLALPACRGVRVDDASAEARSGADAYRSGAVAISPNLEVLDHVDISTGDRTDWKKLELSGRPGALEVELSWENPKADLELGAFDAKGVQIATSPQNNGTPHKKTIVSIDAPGTYYLRIVSLVARQGTEYTLTPRWDGESPAPPPPRPQVEEPRPRPHPPVVEHHEARPPRKRGAGSPEAGLQGRIVSARREGEGMVLYIDKGRAAGVAEGQNGWVLEGASGSSPLDGGTFTITSVVDDARSIGKTGLRSIAKNNRVSINTGK